MASVLDSLQSAARSGVEALVSRPASWLWQCCVRRPYPIGGGGAPLWLRPPRYGGRAAALLGPFDASSAAAHAGELFFPLLTMSIYGATHYMRWSNLARAVGVRFGRRSKALVFGSYLLLPNLLVPILDVRCLHVVLVVIVTANNLYLYREFCIMEQMHVYGQRLPGEPVLVGLFQAINVLHDALEEPGRMLWRRVRRHVPALLTPKLHMA